MTSHNFMDAGGYIHMGMMRKILMQAMMLVIMVMMSVVFSKEVGAETKHIDWIESVHVTPNEVLFGKEINVQIRVEVNEEIVKPKKGEVLQVEYSLPYLNEEEEEQYQIIYLNYNEQTKRYEAIYKSEFNYEQIGTWAIHKISPWYKSLVAYNSNVYEEIELADYESLEDLSDGDITLQAPPVGWNYIELNGTSHWYYVDAETLELATGWLYEGGKWYYLDEYTGQMQTGWMLVDEKWYYLQDNGEMLTGWKLINEKWYYLKDNGEIALGWTRVDGKRYYFKDNGELAIGWIDDGIGWNYLENNGEAKTGWLYENGKWYYLDQNGLMATGWLKEGNSWYYLNQNGSMATGKLFIDKKWYEFADNGVMIAS
ncbi:N-acetylmuramoyl-L-alanine amidase family protein [Bacillus pseudomycoides]|uniref:N-acetylmuramoyl-L-alanine amidase family protein n=1 Tax=Bacillus pseudomycoides TaxID=64104 RepID=UPI0020FFFE76|nr:N-acetylmuramoyl-L-alanine amidase family protein [Bacillus pseudomycoides]